MKEISILSIRLKRFSILFMISQIIFLSLSLFFSIIFVNIFNYDLTNLIKVRSYFFLSVFILGVLSSIFAILSLYELEKLYKYLYFKISKSFYYPHLGTLMLLSSLYSIIGIFIFIILFSYLTNYINILEGLTISLPIIIIIGILGVIGQILSLYLGLKRLAETIKLSKLLKIAKLYLISALLLLFPLSIIFPINEVLSIISSIMLYKLFKNKKDNN